MAGHQRTRLWAYPVPAVALLGKNEDGQPDSRMARFFHITFAEFILG